MKRRAWTADEETLMRQRYPHERSDTIASDLGRTVRQVYLKARNLGLRKTPEYLASPDAHRLDGKKGMGTRFKKGMVPVNKGIKHPRGWAPGRMAQTQFKKGRPPSQARNYRPVGSTRIVYGNLERKVTDDTHVYPARRWRPVHRLVWEAEHGPVPRGRIVLFKPGMHTTVEQDITLDRLECISRAENMRRNTIHRYPEELVHVIHLRGALNRKINARKRHEKQD